MTDANANPLDVDLSSVDTSFPLVRQGTIVDVIIKNTELSANEAKTLKLEVETLGAVTGQQGEAINPGAKLFDNLNTNATGKATPKMIVQNAGKLVQSLKVTGWKLPDLQSRHAELRGKQGRVRIDIQPAGPDRNGTMRRARNTIEWLLGGN